MSLERPENGDCLIKVESCHVESYEDIQKDEKKFMLLHLSTMNPTTKIIICALGVFTCYFYFGLIQERM